METLAGFRSVCVVDMMRLVLTMMVPMVMGVIVSMYACDFENEISLWIYHYVLFYFVLVVNSSRLLLVPSFSSFAFVVNVPFDLYYK